MISFGVMFGRIVVFASCWVLFFHIASPSITTNAQIPASSSDTEPIPEAAFCNPGCADGTGVDVASAPKPTPEDMVVVPLPYGTVR